MNTTASGTEGIGLFPDERYACTSSVYINEVVKIDTSTLQVVGRALMPNCLGAVRVVPTPGDDRTRGVNCAENGRVLLVHAGTLKVRHEIPVGTWPIGITVPGDRYAYVANMVDATISVIDITRGAVARTIPAGDEPDGVERLRRASASGRSRTCTSSRPDSFDVYAIHRLSGENAACSSLERNRLFRKFAPGSNHPNTYFRRGGRRHAA